jgi:adenosylmethionine-8-amino-7-oxononanoate aminotransferase
VVEREARARGLLLRCGNDFAAFAPPLIVTPEQIDEMTGILGECIAVAERELGAAR